MKTAVIGCCCNYGYQQIEPWVVSLEKSGFKGDKVLLAYNIKQDLVDILQKKDWKVFPALNNQGNVCVNRFYNLHKFLQQTSYDYIVTTDVKDVIFQLDPIPEYRPPIIVSSENLTYEHEPWGKSNLIQSFGEDAYELLKNKTIVNAGVLGGDPKFFSEMCHLVYKLCEYRPAYIPGGGGPDQAALNVIKHNKLTLYDFVVTSSWACQAGTCADPSKIDSFRKFLLEPEPKMNISGKVMTHDNKVYSIIHQYDRVPLWRQYVEKMYRE